ncbi:MAG: glyoxalase superfamily protein [Deltaproteobacteria bacterium]
MISPLPSLTAAKQMAKALRSDLAAKGREIIHSAALELVAKSYGFADWNAFHAALGNGAPPDWQVGQRVTGAYLSQAFSGRIVSAVRLEPGWAAVELDLDEAVDVVTFDSFSNFRKRIRGVVGPDGFSREKTSNGAPQIRLDL